MKLLKYRILNDVVRIISNPKDWQAYIGALRKDNNIIAIEFINLDETNKRPITLMEKTLNYGAASAYNAPSAGGYIDVDGISIKWPQGDANLSIQLQRAVDFHYIEVPHLNDIKKL
jgi:hypothetical protein